MVLPSVTMNALCYYSCIFLKVFTLTFMLITIWFKERSFFFLPVYCFLVIISLLSHVTLHYTVSIYCTYEFLRVKSNSLSGTNSWSVAETNGALVQGGYGHSSVYDSSSHSMYFHGGYKALPANKYGLVDHLYRYQVHTHTWWVSTLCTCNTMEKCVCLCIVAWPWLIISASAPSQKEQILSSTRKSDLSTYVSRNHVFAKQMSVLTKTFRHVWNMTAVTNKLVVTL